LSCACSALVSSLLGPPVSSLFPYTTLFRSTRLRQLIRRPVSDDVIVGFIVGWNFHQLNAAFTPLPFRSHPCAWTKIVTIIEIFKAGEITTALQQTEALRVLHREAADR